MIKAIVMKNRLRYEKGDFRRGEVIDLSDEEADRLKESIKILTPEQEEAFNEAMIATKPEEKPTAPAEAAEAPVEEPEEAPVALVEIKREKQYPLETAVEASAPTKKKKRRK